MSSERVYLKEFAILDNNSRNTNDHTSNPAVVDEDDYLVMLFDALPERMQFKRLIDNQSLHVNISALNEPGVKNPTARLKIAELNRSVDANSLTFNNDQGVRSAYLSDGLFITGTGWLTFNNIFVGAMLNYGVAVMQPYAGSSVSIPTSGASRPYLTVEVDDSETVGVQVSNCRPESGAVSSKKENIFTWLSYGMPSASFPIAAQVSATFRWRTGAAGVIHEISVPGTSQKLVVPENTFPSGTVQWQVAVTANSGVVTTSEWMTLSTLDAKPTAKPISPANTYVDATTITDFVWEHIVATGTVQTKAELQKSTDGSTWTALATITGSETKWTCPAGTLASSTKYWRVRTYNADSVASDWSEAAQIVVVSAPPVPALRMQTAGPRPTFSWQTQGQQAAQVEIVGIYNSGTIYGVSQQWSSPVYLSDGDYTVRVRVQNEYGLWSEWGTAVFQVTNTPGSVIALAARAESTVSLNWQTTGAYDFYLIYRDNLPIAKTAQTQYTDPLSVGPTMYQVRGCYKDTGDYGLSNVVQVDVLPESVMVSDLDTSQWLLLPYASTQNRETKRVFAQTINYLAMSGVPYPIAEVSDNRTDTLTVTASLTDPDECSRLEAMVGRLVCLKTHTQDMTIGYIDTLEKVHDGFVTTYTFSVQQIDYEQEVLL